VKTGVMTARRAQRKVPDGKLVRMDAVCEHNVLSNIRITGDFFVYPEEALSNIERDLNAGGLSGHEEDLEERVGSIVSSNDARLVGFGAKDIADLMRELKC
jgi:lipoate-protein ligase A